MGQYYKAVTVDEKGKLTAYSLQPTIFRETRNFDYYNGVKLMESLAWSGNSFTDFFSRLIYKNPLKCSFWGDYSYDEHAENQAKERNCDFNFSHDEYLTLYDNIWGENSEDVDFLLNKRHFNYRGKYLVNHTKKCYFSMTPFAHKKDEWTIYPVSLLCSIGNGLGGGDFRGPVGLDDVGTWALDVISIEDEAPENYECIAPPEFKEEW